MVDFLQISTRNTKRGLVEIFPKFIIKKSKDLMIRGGDFYAIWCEDKGMWSTDEDDVIRIVDGELRKFYNEHKDEFHHNDTIILDYMFDSDSTSIDRWHKYCQKQMRDTFEMLDETLIFANNDVKKENFSSKRLSYPLTECDISNYELLISTLYDEEERHKLEWAIGSIVTGDSKELQKFLVLYGSAGTGKSTILNIVQKLFDGYYSVFDARALGSSSSVFALESFKNNPLVAIQHDGDLSRIEDNTRLNSLVSHEYMTVNEKYKSSYTNRFKCFLFMGTNKPVKITDAKSGLIRRLIDVTPSGNKLPAREYDKAVKNIDFELGGIAYHCMKVYLSDPNRYDSYIPVSMMGASNDFYNFISDVYFTFTDRNLVTLKSIWELYKNYCDDAKIAHPLPLRAFREELKNYFDDYKDRYITEDGQRLRSVYIDFRLDKFRNEDEDVQKPMIKKTGGWIQLETQKSILDSVASDYPAQYANKEGSPSSAWANVKTTLKEIDTNKLHWLQVPVNHIIIDFDKVDEDGKKSLELNLKEANKFPATYAEVSKGGQGLHLHYIYTGDPSELASKYADHIEVKVYSGNASIRRLLTKCNDINITSINSGLPLKGAKKMLDMNSFKNEGAIRALITKNLRKQYHAGTKPSIDFIKKILDDAYDSGVQYDVTDMKKFVFEFASRSTNQSDYCVKLVYQMKFVSDEKIEEAGVVQNKEKEFYEANDIIFYDLEVFKNFFLIGYLADSDDTDTVKYMIGATPSDIELFIKNRLVGFNNRGYDNHILYGRLLGYDDMRTYNLSKNIITDKPDSKFAKAYGLSYADIYDFSTKKQSLKKFEVELGLEHDELEIDFDKELTEEEKLRVIEYCGKDVIATKYTFRARKADFEARKTLAKLTGMSPNDTTNNITTRFIFGNDRNPQRHFNYRNMSKGEGLHNKSCKDATTGGEYTDKYTIFDKDGKPVFPGYEYSFGKSTYRNEEISEGGQIYYKLGYYENTGILDIMSMHPYTIINEQYFGEKYTEVFKSLVDVRVAIKHNDKKTVRTILNGLFAEYADDDDMLKLLSTVLKIPINSVYGMTCATYDNPFRHPDNKDNLVAKRGALFMVNLRHAVESKGYTVVHIKTDSIKIANIDDKIVDFVNEYGKLYGYVFEYEGHYEKMCLVNKAVYIAKYSDSPINKEHVRGTWTATGTQFSVPYVYKKMFSREEVIFEDLCEIKNSPKSTIFLDYNDTLENTELYEKEFEKRINNIAIDITLNKSLSPKDKVVYDNYVNNNVIIYEKEKRLNPNLSYLSLAELKDKIDSNHNYHFVGKVEKFTPVLLGTGGGELYGYRNNKYNSITGTKGYRWQLSKLIDKDKYQEVVDYGYYDNLVRDAINNISKYCDVNKFCDSENILMEATGLPF